MAKEIEPFNFELLEVEDAKENYPVLWATAKASLPDLKDELIAIVVSLASDTCQSCKTDNGSCQCWNDE